MMLLTALYLLALSPQAILPADTTSPVSYLYVDQPPVFPGGGKGLEQYVKTHLQWPGDICYEGTVVVYFIIEENGKTSNMKVITPHSILMAPGIEQLIKSMPLWQPGSINHKPVRTAMYMPILYRMEL